MCSIIFLDVGLLHALEAHADAALQQRFIIEGALRVGGEAVGRCFAHEFMHIAALRHPQILCFPNEERPLNSPKAREDQHR
jgi:hypothetical protein